jgi:hypothetical protein
MDFSAVYGRSVTAPVKTVVNVVKDVAKSDIGRIALTIGATMALGPVAAGFGIGTAGTAAIVGGGMAALGGGNLQDVLKGAAMGYIGGTVAPSISSYMPGAAGSVLNQGFTGAALGTGFGLASGMTPEQALKAGAVGGLTAAGVGYGQQKGYLPGGAPRTTGSYAMQQQTGSNLSLAPNREYGRRRYCYRKLNTCYDDQARYYTEPDSSSSDGMARQEDLVLNQTCGWRQSRMSLCRCSCIHTQR